MIYNIFSTLTQVLGRFFLGSGFFSDPDFSGSDPDFWPIRIQIRTKEKKSDSDPEKTGSETLSRTGIILIFLNT